MVGEWSQFTLGGLCSLITDGKHGDCEDQPHSGFYFLSVKDIIGDRLVYENARQITEGDFSETNRRTNLEPGDVLFTNTGTIGRMAIAQDDPRTYRTTFQKSVAILKPKRDLIHPRFLYYLLQFDNAKLSDFAAGTTQKNLLLKDLRSFEVRVPSLPEQRAIAHILGTLDDKIELNRQMNETLEAMAQALFKSWFVDFDPVRTKMEGRDTGLPPHLSDLFPDHFEDSVLGEIPVGWEIMTIDQISSLNDWTLTKADSLDFIDYIEISAVVRGNISQINRFHNREEPSRARRRLRHGDTVISTVRPERGSYFLALNPSLNLIASTGFAVVSPKIAPWSLIHAALTHPEVFDFLGQQSDGGAYPAINPDVIGGIQIVQPNESSVLTEFHSICGPLYKKANLGRRESRTLANLRDTLLPKLISGELRVKDAERFVGEAV